MALMTRQETIDYHRAELARLEAEGSTDEDLIEYHREGTEVFGYQPFNEETADALAKLLKTTVEDLRQRHEAFYENEARIENV